MDHFSGYGNNNAASYSNARGRGNDNIFANSSGFINDPDDINANNYTNATGFAGVPAVPPFATTARPSRSPRRQTPSEPSMNNDESDTNSNQESEDDSTNTDGNTNTDENNSTNEREKRQSFKSVTPEMKLELNEQLFDTAARIEDAMSELENCASILSTENAANRKNREAAIKSMEDVIIPFLNVAAYAIRHGAQMLAPFPGMKHIHTRLDNKRKREVLDHTSKERATLQMMKIYVEGSNVKLPSRKKKPKKAEINSLVIPEPEDGKRYTKMEAIRVATQYKKGSMDRGRVISLMIDKGYVVNGKSTIQRVVTQYEEGKPVEGDWPKVQWRVIEREQLDELAKELFEENGKDHDVKKVKTKVLELIRGNILKNGGTEADTKKVILSSSSVRNNAGIVMSKLSALAYQHAAAPTETNERNDELEDTYLPVPKNGKMYTKHEALEVISTFQKGSLERELAFKAIFKRHYIPAGSEAAFKRYITNDEQGRKVPNTPWGAAGNDPLFTDEDLDAMAQSLSQEDGREYELEELQNYLKEAARMKAEERGVPPKVMKQSVLFDYSALLKSLISKILRTNS